MYSEKTIRFSLNQFNCHQNRLLFQDSHRLSCNEVFHQSGETSNEPTLKRLCPSDEQILKDDEFTVKQSHEYVSEGSQNLKQEQFASTLQRNTYNYNNTNVESSTGGDSDLEGNQLQIDEIISITQDQTQVQPHARPQPSKLVVELPKRRNFRNHYGKKSKKNRKIRTTITKQKLVEMNRIFAQYTSQKEEGKNPQFNLKEIGQQLQLGYSTILHKFRQFRATKKVKGGALIASLQKKRKYKKSVQIEQIIERALTERPFYTAVELSKYILCKFQRNFSRSIISRHLGEMGYSYKNLKSTPLEKNKPKYKQIRRMYAQIIKPLLNNDKISHNIVYIDQMACSLSNFVKRKGNGEFKKIDALKEEEEYISVLIAARNEEIIHYEVSEGFISRQDFCNALIKVRFKTNQSNKYNAMAEQIPIIIISDLNKIHRDAAEGESQIVKQTLSRLNMRQYFLPPFSFQLNPLETIFLNIKNKMSKRDIKAIEQLHAQLLQYLQQLEKENTEVHFKQIADWLQKSLREQNF